MVPLRCSGGEGTAGGTGRVSKGSQSPWATETVELMKRRSEENLTFGKTDRLTLLAANPGSWSRPLCGGNRRLQRGSAGDDAIGSFAGELCSPVLQPGQQPSYFHTLFRPAFRTALPRIQLSRPLCGQSAALEWPGSFWVTGQEEAIGSCAGAATC